MDKVKASMSRRFAAIYGTTFVSSVVAFWGGYVALRWLLISYQTWRLGRPNPFVIVPDLDALLLALLAAAIAFWLVVKRAKRNRP
jgi:succinate dehydrogenase hydrophobic anchor subunit